MTSASPRLAKLVKFIIPSISELEFVFFATLMAVSGTLLGLKLLNAGLNDLGNDLILDITGGIILLGLLYLFLSMAYKAASRGQPINNELLTARYVVFPAFMMVVFAIVGLFEQTLSEDSFSKAEVILVLVNVGYFVRYGLIIAVGLTIVNDKYLRKSVAQRFDNYQAGPKEALVVAMLAILINIGLLITATSVICTLIAYSIGRSLLKVYRQYRV